jgi:hypothetical protein
MTIRRLGDTIFLEGVCAVEDAEVLLQQLQAGADLIDWSGCAHLHTACFQLLLATRVPMSGTPVNPELARWLAPILHSAGLSVRDVAAAETETLCEMEP